MIYPVPQKLNLNGEKIELKSVSVSGDFKAITEKVFGDYGISVNGGFNVVFRCENSKKTTYAEEICRLTDEKYINIISCPTCGRTKIDLIKICEEIEDRLPELPAPSENLTVAVMGCAVNGPGEAREADIGIAGGDGEGLLFAHGKIIRKIAENNIVDELFDEIRKLI